MEPAAFLRSQPPFDRLTGPQFGIAERNLEIAFVPGGDVVLRRGGPRSEFLYVVRKGAIRLERDGQLVQELEEGDAFGFPSLIGRASPHVDAIAAEDALLYRLPAAAFDELMKAPAFAEYFAGDLAARLRAAATEAPLPMQADLALPASRLVRRAPVTIARTATVGEAAARMRDEGVSSVLISGTPPGILTDRDLRNRVLAAGRGADTPLAEVMTAPVQTLDAGASLFEVLLFMLDRHVHHAPLAQGGAIVGVITDTDLLRAQATSPLHVLKRVSGEAAKRAGYAAELTRIVESLAATGLEAAQIGRVVARLNDALVAGLLAEAETALGPPPSPYAWIVLGSEGRLEQTLLTDQDNALVYGTAGGTAPAYFASLAERVVRGLVDAGFPSCPGGYMATHWCRPLEEWERIFRGWIETPEPKALLDASLFLDYRVVHGALSLEPLQRLLHRASGEQVFLAQLARNAIGFEPPLGAFRTIKLEDGGVDLKKGGLQPIVALARLLALAAGSDARPTLARLTAAADAGTLSREGAANLAEAFRFLLRLRLDDQLRARRESRPLDAVTSLDRLSALERQHLKAVFLAVRETQSAIRLRYATERLAGT